MSRDSPVLRRGIELVTSGHKAGGYSIDDFERLQRVLAARGAGSRRRAETMMREGRVTVDGEIVTELGTKVSPRATDIRVDGKVLHPRPMRYILLNKPPGYITTTNDERGRPTVLDLVQISERVFPVGRLDRATEGLLLLTNDGDVANRVMHPRYKLAKEYHVLTLSRPLDPILQRVRDGIVLDGRRIVPSDFRILRETREGLILTIVLHEGMHHVVRRLMEEVGIEVDRLRRVRVGPLTLKGLPLGGSRDLSTGERANLFEAIQLDREIPGEKHDASTRDQASRPSIKTRKRRRSRTIGTSPLPRDT